LELIAPMQIDVLPGDGRYFLGCFRASCVPGFFLVLKEPRQERGIVENDAVGNQPTAFRPEILLVLGLEAEFAEAGERDCTAELMIVFTPVKGFLDMLPQCR
jgi:hypothetical protein